MSLVLKKQRGGGPRRYRYGGSGIFDGLIQRLFSSGVKSVINRGVNSVVAHKLANTVVNGATTVAKKTANAALNGATQAVLERAVKEVVNTVTPYVKKKLIGVVKKKTKVGDKRHAASPTTQPPAAKRININSLIDGSFTPTSAERVNINSLIDGSGIVFD